jgi:phenylpyruvate tautomerase PptA (4-oxalocrotonate tautomerase family)
MPICLIEAPTGIRADAKKKLFEQINAVMDQTWHIPDVRIFLREYLMQNVAQDGRPADRIRPVCFLEVPLIRDIEARRTLIAKIHAAVADAYDGIANTQETMTFINQYELENVGWQGTLQSDKPEIVEVMRKLNGVGI